MIRNDLGLWSLELTITSSYARYRHQAKAKAKTKDQKPKTVLSINFPQDDVERTDNSYHVRNHRAFRHVRQR